MEHASPFIPLGYMMPVSQTKVLVLLQDTTDHMGRFLDVDIGHSRGNHNVHVFQNSTLYAAMDASSFIPGDPSSIIGGVRIPPSSLLIPHIF